MYNAPKILYVLYNTKTHEWLQDNDCFGEFESCRLFTNIGHIKNSLKARDEQDTRQNITTKDRIKKLDSGEYEIKKLEITKWSASNL